MAGLFLFLGRLNVLMLLLGWNGGIRRFLWLYMERLAWLSMLLLLLLLIGLRRQNQIVFKRIRSRSCDLLRYLLILPLWKFSNPTSNACLLRFRRSFLIQDRTIFYWHIPLLRRQILVTLQCFITWDPLNRLSGILCLDRRSSVIIYQSFFCRRPMRALISPIGYFVISKYK